MKVFVARMLLHSWGFSPGTILVFLCYEQITDNYRWYRYLSDGRVWTTAVEPTRGVELGYWSRME